ncbi:MAG: SEC-C metal-binding domain-containing protein [Archangium sp.]|nr:SEC-C metal-binding domain-containing protein [Archangium sp.]
MLKPDSTLARQLSADGPMLLWRVGPDGRREGLAISTEMCVKSTCPCRGIVVRGWRAGDDLVGACIGDGRVTLARKSEGGARDDGVLCASVDVDTREVAHVNGAPFSQDWALEWLNAELDDELFELLRARFAAGKAHRPAAIDWRKEDWSWWKPGLDVAWQDVHPDEEEFELEAGGAAYALTDFYCVEPGCGCEEINIFVARLEPGEGDVTSVGVVALNPTYPAAALFQAHGRDRETLKQVWAAFVAEEPIDGLLIRRREVMRAHAAEIHRLFAIKRAPANRNDPCPCGSGLKYKKCCLGKSSSNSGKAEAPAPSETRHRDARPKE